MRASSAAMKSAICFFSALEAGAQFVVGKGFYGRVDGFDLFEIRLDLLAVLVGFGAEDEFD